MTMQVHLQYRKYDRPPSKFSRPPSNPAGNDTPTPSYPITRSHGVYGFPLNSCTVSSNSYYLTSSQQPSIDMQFKTLFALVSFAAVAFAAPADPADASADAEQLSLTTQFTTDTFTATRILQSMMTQAPFITTLTQTTVWTVEHTVTVAAPTAPPA
ncbi:hypothetical protein GSI_00046 [Ganoderma sinense ZZ0214-1]|uniref:Uncharacterized protein n=1 Tax=Ganoderma sinense ZZ0214-1 TaxID=1077348 RepID=A0A2G8SS05_9APHY|nr:hypothetical protein GSI_00046 [Ganoderma sinense ZZ0214-1]